MTRRSNGGSLDNGRTFTSRGAQGTHTPNILSRSVIEISRGAAARVRKGAERVTEEVRPPALIPRDSAAEKPEARWAAEAAAAVLPAVRGAPSPSQPRDCRGRADWGWSGGHMFPLFHTQSSPPLPPPFLLSPAILSPPLPLSSVLWASPPLHQLSMFLDRNQSVICQLLSIRP